VAMRGDPVTTEVIGHHLTAIAEEMKRAIIRTAMHPIIYEVFDFSTGVFDARGTLAAQAAGLSIFLGTLDWAVAAAMEKFGARGLDDGDVILTNDPYVGGGTHLSDVSVVAPVFHERRLIGFVASRAHWNDIGGAVPLSVQTNARDIYAEGLTLPVVRLFRRGQPNRDVFDLIGANVRESATQLGDLQAQLAAARVGVTRLVALAGKYGGPALAGATRQLQSAAEARTRRSLREIPDGTYLGEDFLDDDGIGGPPARIAVRAEKYGDHLHLDFSDSAPANPSGYNMTRCSLVSACRVVMKAITEPHGPANDGSFRPLTVAARPGSVVDATHPTPVSLYGEPARRAIDAVWRALAPAVPKRLPAGHFGTIAGLAISGWDDRRQPAARVSFQGPNGGGWGASQGRDGESALCPVTNGDTRNTPVEVIEAKAPLRVRTYKLRADSGGAGEWRGGLGTIYEFEVLTGGPFFLTCALGRTKFPPFGIEGGHPGATNFVEIERDGQVIARLARATAVTLAKGDVVRVTTGGGGGYGDPRRRSAVAMQRDLELGYVTAESRSAEET
jgi:N-methylhydantoinase B